MRMICSLLLGSAAVGALSGTASAQETAPQVDALGEQSGLGEIVVTAQRRSERLQDVPVAVTAFNAEALEARSITSISGIEGLAPNVKFTSAAGYPSYSAVAIRGAYELNTAPFYDQPTGVYIDGVFIGKAQGSLFDLTDIQSIEILRGPQGTLFGRNTLAGAVNITTRKPSGEWRGEVEAGLGNFDQRRLRASIDLPRMGPLSLNFAGLVLDRDGYFRSEDTPYASAPSILPLLSRTTDEFNAINSKSARIAARLEVSEAITADYSFDYSRQRNRPGLPQVTRIGAGGIFDPTSAAYVGVPLHLYVRPDRSREGYLNGAVDNAAPIDNVTTRGHALTLTWQAETVTLKSITALREQDYRNRLDLDATPYLLAAASLTSDYESFSQELQVTGSLPRVNYTGGIYYFWDDGRVDNPQQYFGGGSTTLSQYHFGTEAWAAYGQVDYTPPVLDDKLTLTAGLRYSSEEKETDRLFGSLTGGTVTYFVPPGTRARARFNSLTPTLIAKYSFGRDLNAYVKYAKGFKSGGFGGEASTVAEAVRPFAPETVDTYEIGLKSELFDRRLRLNIAAFWNERKDMQLSVFTGFVGGLAQTAIRNAGRARVRGFEVEAQARPAEWLSISASLGHLDGKFKELIEADPATGQPSNVAADREFPVAPQWTGSLSVDARVATFGRAELHALVDYTHSDQAFQGAYDPVAARVAPLDAYDTIDARLRLSDLPAANGSVAVTAWVRNLTNEQHRVGGFDFGPAFGNLTLGYFNPPRTYGIDISYRF